jgi:RNA polymerase sigma-32 factor
MRTSHAAIRGDEALDRLAAQARRVPLLTPERERELGIASRDRGDVAAREELIESHIRLVLSKAARMAGYGLPMRDLVSQGMLGLLRAAEKFDPDQPARFATYATWWIRSEMTEYVVRNGSIVRNVTSAGHRVLFFRLKRTKEKLGIVHSNDLTDDEARAVATATGTTVEDVKEMNRRIGMGGDASLDAPMATDDGEDGSSGLDRLRDNGPDPFEAAASTSREDLHREVMASALSGLAERERDIVVSRHFVDETMTLEELGQRYGVTRERIRQIEAKALRKIESHLRSFQRDRRINLLAA